MQPGDTITPQGEHKPDSAKKAAVTRAEKKPATPTPHSHAPAAENLVHNVPTPKAHPLPEEPVTPWQYSQENNNENAALSRPSLDPVSWSASEFVDHEKNSSWFLGLAGISVVGVAIIYFITGDPVTVVVVSLAAILFAVTAKRKPRTLAYQIDAHGIKIGDKGFPYEIFKSFSVLEEGAFNSIQLMPLKRFMPPISLYYPPENEAKIIDTLGSYLPHEERDHDAIDRLMRRVRF